MSTRICTLVLFTVCIALSQQPATSAENIETAATVTQPPLDAMQLLREGDRLIKGEGGSADVNGALAAYEAAAANGSTIALLRLGDLYVRGTLVTRDFEKAFSYYHRAADAGNSAAKLRVAEMTARGQGTAQDVEGGRAMARELADAGDPSALFDLGEFYSIGDAGPVDGPAAVSAYEKAAEKGSVPALIRLGVIFRDGDLAAKDPARALGYFRQAADAGSDVARFAIGKGYILDQFAGAGSPKEGVAMVEELNKAGIRDAALVLSDSYLSGQGVKRSPKRAVAVLVDAMEQGNMSAARRLIAVYRDGRGSAVKPNLALAKRYLMAVSDQLDQNAMSTEEVLLDAAGAANSSDFATMREHLSDVNEEDRPDLARKIRSTNANAYVYLVQYRLKELGVYAGRPNGQLNQRTIRAMLNYCANQGMKAKCIRGPLSAEALEVFQPIF